MLMCTGQKERTEYIMNSPWEIWSSYYLYEWIKVYKSSATGNELISSAK